jgi:putative ABC transport system permease protein
MIRNYLKVAMRYLLRNKGYTAINILGLAIGITCCILIMMFVRSEFSYDKFHSKSERIYRAWVREHNEGMDDIIDIVTPYLSQVHYRKFSGYRINMPCL